MFRSIDIVTGQSATNWRNALSHTVLVASIIRLQAQLHISQKMESSPMYAPFLVVAAAAGAPRMLAFLSNLFSSMTHNDTGLAPVFFGSGYVEMSTW